MSRRVALRRISHARAGDKGNISNISLWVNEPRHFPAVKAQMTAERVAEAYRGLLQGDVTRYSLDHLHGLNFVLEEALEGGVNGSLNLDGHGKSFSFILLDIEVNLPD